MGQKLVIVLAGIFILFAAWPSQSLAQIINTSDIDAVCRTGSVSTHRNTIVYVDLSSLDPREKEWGYTILSKLELAPRERITVLGVNPSNFEIIEVFESCYPTWTPSEISQMRAERNIWAKLISEDPESQQRDNLQVFKSRLGNSLDKLLAAAKNFSLGKRRDVLGAIAVDKNRFADPNAFYRLLVFTNGSILDDFESGANETQIVDLLTQKYPTSFSGAEVFVFGVTGGERNQAIESKEKVFSSFFLKNWAYVRSFTPSLPQQDHSSFSALKVATGTFDGGGIKGSAKLSLAMKNAEAADMWLTFKVGANTLYVPMEGDYLCTATDCKLNGRIIENVPMLSPNPYFRKGDKLAVAGKQGEKLTGSLTSETKEVFKQDSASQRAEDVKYTIDFSALN